MIDMKIVIRDKFEYSASTGVIVEATAEQIARWILIEAAMRCEIPFVGYDDRFERALRSQILELREKSPFEKVITEEAIALVDKMSYEIGWKRLVV